MSYDDPFGDDGDGEKTVIRPNPGGRRGDGGSTQARGDARPTEAPAPVAAPQPMPTGEVIPIAQTGLNSLVRAASSLLGLAIRLRNRAQHSNVEALRERVIAEIKGFEQRALQAGEPAQSVRIARYALCATIDDLVLNTPWGSQSSWAQQSMVGTFHNEVTGGERFYDLMEKMQKDPSRNREILELLYLCMSLGFEGMLRVDGRGAATHNKLRDSVLRDIRAHRPDNDPDLSPHWMGAGGGHRALSSYLPMWLVVVITLGLLCLTYAGFAFFLNSDSDKLYGELNALPPTGAIDLARTAPPPAPVVLDTTQFERVKTFLAPEIAEKLVSAFEDANTITVRIHSKVLAKVMFPSGRDQVTDAYLPTIRRIGAALEDEPGAVLVAGHSDNDPIRTARFPSNWHLSQARAEAVARLLADSLSDDGRLTAEGRADNEPIASNDTTAGKAENRRIEVILIKN